KTIYEKILWSVAAAFISSGGSRMSTGGGHFRTAAAYLSQTSTLGAPRPVGTILFGKGKVPLAGKGAGLPWPRPRHRNPCLFRSLRRRRSNHAPNLSEVVATWTGRSRVRLRHPSRIPRVDHRLR